MSRLGRVSGDIVEALLSDFLERLGGTGGLVGGYRRRQAPARALLSADKVDAIMEDIRGPAGRTVWDKLGNVDESVLASYLKNEYPQTIARGAVAHPRRARRAGAGQPARRSRDRDGACACCAWRWCKRTILDDVERTLRAEFMSNLARSQRRDNHEVMAEIFNSLDRSTETRFLELLEERNKESADRIRALMFTFEDLAKLDGHGIQTLLRHVDSGKLGLALKGASESAARAVLSPTCRSAPPRSCATTWRSMGPVRLRDVEEAQTVLVTTAKELAAPGECSSPTAKTTSVIY